MRFYSYLQTLVHCISVHNLYMSCFASVCKSIILVPDVMIQKRILFTQLSINCFDSSRWIVYCYQLNKRYHCTSYTLLPAVYIISQLLDFFFHNTKNKNILAKKPLRRLTSTSLLLVNETSWYTRLCFYRCVGEKNEYQF